MAKNSSVTNKKPPSKRGRPTKFKPAILRQVRFLAKKGFTDKELSEFFRVSEKTLNTWKKAHPVFLQSLKDGKAVANDKVQNSLFQKAIGYSHPDTHVSNHQGTVTLTPVVKHYPPDTTACIFWLKNRKPTEWRDKVESNVHITRDIVVEIGGDAT